MLATQLQTPTKIDRPWGFYEILFLDEDTGYKIKRIHMNPKARLSLQKHSHRSEIWTMISGEALVRINQHSIKAQAGDTIQVPQQAIHRITNTSDQPLIFMEVQMGHYLGEDDIERFEDDYERHTQ